MLAILVSLALKIGGGLLGFAEKRSDAAVEKLRIQTGKSVEEIRANVALSAQAAAVIQTGMQSKIFWIPWLMAAGPLAFWFGWGVLDSAIMDGSVLPDVAVLPPQIKEYADTVWQNLFFVGGGVAGAQAVATGIAKAVTRR